MLYIIGWQLEGPLKVGFARDPQKRLRELQTGCPYRLCVLATGTGAITGLRRKGDEYVQYRDADDRSLEREVHHHLRGRNLEGEWFDVSFQSVMERETHFPAKGSRIEAGFVDVAWTTYPLPEEGPLNFTRIFERSAAVLERERELEEA